MALAVDFEVDRYDVRTAGVTYLLDDVGVLHGAPINRVLVVLHDELDLFLAA